MTTASTLSAAAFAAKWRDNARRERASSQEHFIDLCRMLGVPTPNDPPASPDYTFEAGAERLSTGSQGWADVWKRGCFGWEYKGAHADLAAAYKQLVDYRDALDNPPLLVVSDMDRIEVRTTFTNTRPAVHVVTLDDLVEDGERTAEALRVLRAVMLDPEALRPEQTPDEITQLAAARFAQIARSMHERGHDPEAVAHHLNRVVFCLFAEDARLLPPGILTGMIASRRSDPEEFDRGLSALFAIMSDPKTSRFFGNERIEWFNGGLFNDAGVIPCTADELRAMHDAALLDWSRIEPAILGTLFERGLDPEKRGQLGAHYTDHEKILMVVEPVVLAPLRREYAAMQARVEELTEGREPSPLTLDGRRRERLPAWEREAEAAWRAFLERLRAVRVLDPACGSGNFLYVTLRLLKDLEHEAIRWGAQRLRVTGEFPQVGPQNVLGIEIKPYARELAGVSIWIGHIQWMMEHGSGFPRDPVLEPLSNIELRDAILAQDDEGTPVPATLAGGRVRRRQPAVPGDEADAALPRRRLRQRPVRGVAGGRRARVGPCLLLARACAAADRGRRYPTGRAARDELHTRRREPLDTRSGKGERRHLHGVVGRAVGSRGCRCPRLDRRPGRRFGDRARTRRPAGRDDQQQPDRRRRPHRGSRTPRERRRVLHGRHEGRAFRRHRRRGPGDARAADERERPPKRRCRRAVGERAGRHAAGARDVHYRLRG
ncbi:MAG: class I SAM-dependent DNA methyltransferase [Dehalococcoidia bacterium]|nr:class I SAM-dependent DNA methyltransferase [Dehalococcoidia bacterium]MYA54454.1 class I SAM-dependent DNA methyltransferase [Dehalococcoidia bacterium]